MNKQKFLDIKNRWETKEYMGEDEYNMVDDSAFLITAVEQAQAEVERLRASHEELTPEEIKNKYFPNQTWEELGRKRAKSIFDKEI